MAEDREPLAEPANDDDFYTPALEHSERRRLPRARKVQGLDEEIALLRVQIRRHLETDPEDTTTFLRLTNALVEAVKARSRLSSRNQDALYEGVRAVLRDIGGPLLLEHLAQVAPDSPLVEGATASPPENESPEEAGS